MVAIRHIPRRGDIVWIDFDPTRGHEQNGRRPAVVVSPEAYNKLSNRALFCPITSTSKGYIFEVAIEGKDVVGAILVDQIRTLDWNKRHIAFIEKAPLASMDDVEAKLLTLVRP